MINIDYIGFDIHKKTISYCAKAQDGTIRDEGQVPAERKLSEWAKVRPRVWIGAMEATLFSGWIYDHLKPWAKQLKVANPSMLKAIAQVEERQSGRAEDRRPAALRSFAGVLYGAEQGARPAAGASLSQPDREAVHANEEPYRRAADGDGNAIQQTAAARSGLF